MPPLRLAIPRLAPIVAVGVALFVAAACPAQTTSADDESLYQERLEYDPATGKWIAIAPPIPGTEDGDLALARFLLARNKYAKARKAFAAWMKAYPESPKWPEALLYAAETEISAEDEKPKAGDLIQAYEWLKEIVEGWPGTESADRALRKHLIIAEMLLFKDRKQKIWKGTLHLSAREEALQMLDRVIDDYARETPIAEQALRLKADYHYQAGEFEEAEEAYARLLRDFARGRYAKISLLRCGESAYARFPGVEFDDADLLEAEVYLQDFRAKYPKDAEESIVPQALARIRDSRAEKDFRVAQWYERIRRINAAAYYYRTVDRNYPDTTWGAQAHARLIAIGAIEPDEELPEPATAPASETPTETSANDSPSSGNQ
ncbi:MAG: hypothetical protein HBSAPP02_09070 [Phycisphaerae bacterium]|nr:MAG: hypothetical protein DCC66_00875 [Planctomycetota bacterium]GJQ25875.1 MAG: hypothetical protein HBSAPP02_09070 [Phycisphaerae bacterium]